MVDIRTPWGSISTKVSLFPIYYLIFIYGFVYILPFGKNLIGITWFDLLKKEDGPLEWLQFGQFFISSLMGIYIFYKSKKKRSINSWIWLFFSVFCFTSAHWCTPLLFYAGLRPFLFFMIVERFYWFLN